MGRASVKAVAAKAQRDDAALRQQLAKSMQPPAAKGKGKGAPLVSSPTLDSFTNFAHKMGVGADNPLSTASYGFNPLTRNRTLLEWIHRGSWLGGVAIDLVADDMTRAGVDYVTELHPDLVEQLDNTATAVNTWSAFNEVIKWGRLYGGAIAVALVDGQDPRTPLRLDTIGPDQYKGILVLDRWMLEPDLGDLVTEYGPLLGLPKYYRVGHNAPALRGAVIHYSRILTRFVGVELPYQQRLMENLWGMSVIERFYDRMIAFDSATTGAAQLVYKSFLRTLSVDGLRDVVAAGGAPFAGLMSYVENMRRFQGNEGITMIDAKDKFETQSHSAFSGLDSTLIQFGQQISGALQIPLVRLFGQSPAGLNSTGESDLRMFYDHIRQQQVKHMHYGVTLHYRLLAKSNSVPLPPNFTLAFKSLWELTDADKANIAKTGAETVSAALSDGTIGRQTALRELRQQSRVTGVFTNITTSMIAEADDEVNPAPPAGGLPGMPGAPGDEPPLGSLLPPGSGDLNAETGPNGQAGEVDNGSRGGSPLPLTALRRRPTSGVGG